MDKAKISWNQFHEIFSTQKENRNPLNAIISQIWSSGSSNIFCATRKISWHQNLDTASIFLDLKLSRLKIIVFFSPTYRGIKYLIFTIPTLPGTLLKQYQELKEKKAEEERLIKEEEELQQKKLEEKQERKQRKKDRKRIIYDEKQEGVEDSNNSGK